MLLAEIFPRLQIWSLQLPVQGPCHQPSNTGLDLVAEERLSWFLGLCRVLLGDWAVALTYSHDPVSTRASAEKGSGEEKRDYCARGGGTNCVISAEGRGGSLRGLVGRPGP